MVKRLGCGSAVVVGLLALWWLVVPKISTYWSPDGDVAVSISDRVQGGHRNICHLVSKHAWWDILYPDRYLGVTDTGVFKEAYWTSNDRVVIVGQRLEKSLTDRPIKKGDIRFAGVEVVWQNR